MVRKLAIMLHETHRNQATLEVIDGSASYLNHPFLDGMSGDSSHGDAARLQVQEEQCIIGCQAAPGEHLDCAQPQCRPPAGGIYWQRRSHRSP
jgi:hypothetical protein